MSGAKTFLVYWLLGCALVGMCLGSAHNKCPNDPIDSAETALAVSVWPAWIFAALMISPPSKPYACKRSAE